MEDRDGAAQQVPSEKTDGGTPSKDDASAQASAAAADGIELVRHWQAEVLAARHQLLVNRDHSVGVQAEIGRLNREVIRLNGLLRVSDRRVQTLVKRRDALTDKLATARARAERARAEALSARHRVAELEAAARRPSFAGRVVRRLRRVGR